VEAKMAWDNAGQKQLFEDMLVQAVRFWRGKGNQKKNAWPKENSFISVLAQFSLHTPVFTVLAAVPDSDHCGDDAPTNWFQKGNELKRLLN
jgi:hypothetical protein